MRINWVESLAYRKGALVRKRRDAKRVSGQVMTHHHPRATNYVTATPCLLHRTMGLQNLLLGYDVMYVE